MPVSDASFDGSWGGTAPEASTGLKRRSGFGADLIPHVNDVRTPSPRAVRCRQRKPDFTARAVYLALETITVDIPE